MEYREIKTAPENEKLSVVWGEKSDRPEYGTASQLFGKWYIYGQQNEFANGKSCATPDGWLPRNREDWTKAERRLCDILAMHPELS